MWTGACPQDFNTGGQGQMLKTFVVSLIYNLIKVQQLAIYMCVPAFSPESSTTDDLF